MKLPRRPVVLSLLALSLLACNADNRGAKQGAAGGALLGLTMGALTGDADLAMRGMVAGAVAGGVSGNMADLDATRASERNDRTAGAIENQGSGGAASPAAPARSATWERLGGLLGNWDCNAWGLNDQGQRVEASAAWSASSAGAQSVKFKLDSIDVVGVDETSQGSIAGYFQLSFSQQEGYELLTSFGGPDNRWVGEKVGGEERYRFYHVSGATKNQNVWLDLRFLGTQVMVVDTSTSGKDGDVQLQSFRFTRRG